MKICWAAAYLALAGPVLGTKRHHSAGEQHEPPTKEVKIEQLWWDLSSTVPADVWLNIFSMLDMESLWKATSINKVFHGLLKSNKHLYDLLYSLEGQKVRMIDYLAALDAGHLSDLLKSTEEALPDSFFFAHAHLLLKSSSWEFTAGFCKRVLRCRKICELNGLYIFPHQQNPFLGPKFYWPDSYWTPSATLPDILQHPSLRTRVVPAMRFGADTFTPAFIHAYILPVWRNERVLTDAERELFAIIGPIISPAFEVYFGFVLQARSWETKSLMLSEEYYEETVAIKDLVEQFHLSWTELQPCVRIPRKHQRHIEVGQPLFHNATLGIFRSSLHALLMIASHWVFDISAILSHTRPEESDAARRGMLSEVPLLEANEPVPFKHVCQSFSEMDAIVSGRVATRGLLFEQPFWEV